MRGMGGGGGPGGRSLGTKRTPVCKKGLLACLVAEAVAEMAQKEESGGDWPPPPKVLWERICRGAILSLWA